MTRDQIIAKARERADAVRSGRWNDDDLVVMLGAVHWREWANILSHNALYRVRSVSVTPDANGLIAKSDLSSTTQFFYRILSLKQSDRYFAPIPYREAPTPDNTTERGWYESGDYLQLVPPDSATTTVTVNHRPKKASALEANDTVVFPDEHEWLLIYMLAGEMLMKGGAETEAAKEMFGFARGLREDMLQDIGRLSVSPTVMQPSDDLSDWGSE